MHKVVSNTTHHGEPVQGRFASKEPTHPVLTDMPSVWDTPVPDEIYEITAIHKGTQVLATLAGTDGREHPAVWLHKVAGTRVVAITPAHESATLTHPCYTHLVSNTFDFLMEK